MASDLNEFLLNLNRDFYEGYAQSFSATRYGIQPGIQRLLPDLLAAETILDLGCGNGNLARALLAAGFAGSYLGLDNSRGLLQEASVVELSDSQAKIAFAQADLSRQLPIEDEERFEAIVAFAVLHHFPPQPYLANIFDTAQTHLEAGGIFYLSSWQVKHNPRLQSRIQPWEVVGLDALEMGEDDLLLDWRGDDKLSPRYRYVRHYDSAELRNAGERCGLGLRNEFFSDGKEGNLALYQLWQKPA